jgi:hypothetical protein
MKRRDEIRFKRVDGEESVRRCEPADRQVSKLKSRWAGPPAQLSPGQNSADTAIRFVIRE